MDIQKLTEMLNNIPPVGAKENKQLTFLEIAGYPQLENVTSNILQFFFDSRQRHGLGSLFLQCLLESAGESTSGEVLQVDSVKREVPTLAGTRIDLVISTQTLLIGIEDKLYYGLNNDLQVYKDYLDKEKKQRDLVCILLSLFPIPSDIFKPVTYTVLFENIRRNISKVMVGANQHYLPFLFDFMQSVEHLRQEPVMPDKKFRTWVQEHEGDLSTLFHEISDYKKQILSILKKLLQRIDISKYDNSGVLIKPWFYDGMEVSQVAQALVFDVELPDGLTFAIDVILSPIDWKITVVGRNRETIKEYEDFFDKIPGLSYKKVETLGDTFEHRRLVGEKLDFDADLASVAEKVLDLIDRIVAQTKKGKRKK